METLRDRTSHLLQTTADHVALIPATSYGLALAARNLALHPVNGYWSWPVVRHRVTPELAGVGGHIGYHVVAPW